MNNILLTGGAGFIGSHMVELLLEVMPDANIFNLDKLTYAGKLENLASVSNHPRYKFIKGDICDEKLINDLFTEHEFKSVFHFAAESHVDNSIEGPRVFVDTNVIGTFTLIHAAKTHWKNEYSDKKFMHVSTDEVYGFLNENDPLFTEETPYAPSSPYSASKASADHLVSSYYHTFKFPAIITNCSNNYGPHQDKEKLIPTIIRKALAGESIPVYGKGENIRDWLYVKDHCLGIFSAYKKGKIGEKYNIGTNNEWKNIDLVRKICSILDELKPSNQGKYDNLITFVQDRLGHDLRYGIDSSKILNETGWSPKFIFENSLKETIKYYIELFERSK